MKTFKQSETLAEVPTKLKTPANRPTKPGAFNASGLGWASFGIIALCGICCSLPLLAGGLVAGTTILAFLTMAWPIALVVGFSLAIIGLLFFRKRIKHLAAAQTCASSDGSCATRGTCGCKNKN